MSKTKELIESLAQSSAEAHTQLRSLGRRAVATLRGAVRDNPNALVREQCAEILGDIGSTAAVPDLIAALRDDVVHVRWDALRALEKILLIDLATWLDVEVYRDKPEIVHRKVSAWWRSARRYVWW